MVQIADTSPDGSIAVRYAAVTQWNWKWYSKENSDDIVMNNATIMYLFNPMSQSASCE